MHLAEFSFSKKPCRNNDITSKAGTRLFCGALEGRGLPARNFSFIDKYLKRRSEYANACFLIQILDICAKQNHGCILVKAIIEDSYLPCIFCFALRY